MLRVLLCHSPSLCCLGPVSAPRRASAGLPVLRSYLRGSTRTTHTLPCPQNGHGSCCDMPMSSHLEPHRGQVQRDSVRFGDLSWSFVVRGKCSSGAATE